MVTVNDSENNLSIIQWRCKRGLLELDIMLQHFFEQVYAKLSPEKQSLFEKLLACEDQDLQRWLTGTELAADPTLQDMILVIRHMHAQTLASN